MAYDFYAYQRKRETQDLLGFKKYEEDHIMLAYRQKETENLAEYIKSPGSVRKNTDRKYRQMLEKSLQQHGGEADGSIFMKL